MLQTTNVNISVIIPIYNAEKYLSKCLKSIQQQTNKDFEVILVDDGSTDQSDQICREFADTDNRFYYFRKTNGGTSSARNYGLKMAKGNWILFVDADDWLSADYLTLTPYEQQYDIIQKSFIEEFNGNRSGKKYLIKKRWSTKDKEQLYQFFVSERTNALWDKFISRKLIGDQLFDESLRIGEDLIFFIGLIQKAQSYIHSTTGCYHYMIHDASIMQQMKKNTSQSVENYFSLLSYIKKATQNPYLYSGICARFNTIQLYRNRKNLNQKQIQQLKALFRSIRFSDLKYLSLKWKLKFIVKKISFLISNS